MRNLIGMLLLGLPLWMTAQTRTGINTKSSAGTLHLKPSGSDDPLRVEGIKMGSGAFLLIDDNGHLKTSADRSNLTFVLPAVSNTEALVLASTSETGDVNYEENSSPNGSIGGSDSWSKIPGLESVFNIIEPVNSLNIIVEGITYYEDEVIGTGPARKQIPDGASISFAIGVFLDSKLVAVRNYYLIGTGFGFQIQKWDILGQARNLSVGNHKIEVYATRRNTIGAAGQPINIAGHGQNDLAPNQFMTRGILHISGVYSQ